METDCNNSPAEKEYTEVRCSCRQLVAIRTPDGLAIKCRRCKNIHTIPIKDFEEHQEKSN